MFGQDIIFCSVSLKLFFRVFFTKVPNLYFLLLYYQKLDTCTDAFERVVWDLKDIDHDDKS